MQLRVAIAGVLLVLSAGAARTEPEPARKDAAEAVGEGNASRWLEYYRRERGQDWSPPPSAETKTPPTHVDETPRAQPAPDPAPSKSNRP